jgi:GT2 family glycosyltransferase
MQVPDYIDSVAMIQVSVVIINFNSSKFTDACIRSLQEHTARDLTYEIIVVDNNSKPADYQQLVEAWGAAGGVKIIRSIVNLGFSGGNMLGVQAATGAYLYFLNNDCEVLNDNLSLLYQFMESRPEVGVCTGQMYYGNLDFHHSFGYFPTLSLRLFGSSLLRLFSPGKYPNKKIEYQLPLAVPSITGAAMFINREKFAVLGGFDTTYFLYCEEEDVCLRMRQSGYEVYLVPAARFKHHMGKSTVRNFPIELENYISLLYYHRKFHSYPAYLVLKLIYFFKNIRKVFRHRLYGKLAFYILLGAPLKYSLKHKQQLSF